MLTHVVGSERGGHALKNHLQYKSVIACLSVVMKTNNKLLSSKGDDLSQSGNCSTVSENFSGIICLKKNRKSEGCDSP